MARRITQTTKKDEMAVEKKAATVVAADSTVDEDNGSDEKVEQQLSNAADKKVVANTGSNNKRPVSARGRGKAAEKSELTTVQQPENKKKMQAKQAEEEEKTKNDAKETDNHNKNPVSRKRTREEVKAVSSEPALKKAKEMMTRPVCKRHPGFVLVVGEGDTGQLGLGPDVMDRSKPGRVNIPADVVQVCAGGMHSVCLTESGEVLTFGCNDEGALGRSVADEDECFLPGKVNIAEKIAMVSAGDSHTAALSVDGHLYIWGTFRDANGPIGIILGQGKLETPTQIMKEQSVVKIASGSDHLVCLTANGDIYTLGAAEQGQLGRVPECFTSRGGRRGLQFLLVPSIVPCKKRHTKFSDIWTGQYCTYAKARDTGDIYVWGLNNYYQLGIPDMQNKFVPEKAASFAKDKNWSMISGGQHHTIALDGQGKVYSLGRKEYGRLGLGEKDLEEKSAPTPIPELQDKKCISVNCGTAVSFAVTANGVAYGWGMGSTKQLGQGDDEDDIYEPTIIGGKQLENKFTLMTSAGGQHTIILAADTNANSPAS
jgi:regulator of chromosome condensation